MMNRHFVKTQPFSSTWQAAAVSAVEVGGDEVEVREMGMVQRPAQKRFDLLIEALADPAHFRFGAAAGVGLHHHGVEVLVDPSAGLQLVGEEAALAQLWDGQGEVTHLGGEQPPAVDVAVGGALIGATLVELGAGEGRY